MRKTCCRTKISERVLYAEMDISPVILIYVFRFLDLSDLARAAGTWNKEHMQELLHIAISGNRQFTILVIACLCSCPELVTIEAHGLEFSAEELLFLSKTFESARSGSLQIETDEGYDALCITNIFERELFE